MAGLIGLLRGDFSHYIRPHFEKSECEVCGSDTEHLHVHHVTHFKDLLNDTLEQLHLEYHEDTNNYTDEELQLIRDVMLAKQMRIEYVTCCEPCHLDLHNGNYFSKNGCRKIICLNTLDIFDNGAVAAKWCNGCRMGINLCVNGKRGSHGKHPETGEQLKWMYHDDYLKTTHEEINKKLHPKPTTYKDKLLNRTGKEVICIQTMQVFKSGADGARWCGVSRNAITLCCKGKRKSCGKHPQTGEPLQWMYYDEWLAIAN